MPQNATRLLPHAVQRWAKDLNRVGKRLQESRALVEGLVANLGEDGEGKLPRLNIEMLHELRCGARCCC